MSEDRPIRLTDRSIVSVAGPDAEKLLQGLLTNAIENMAEGDARHAALLTPQGKLLFELFVVRRGDAFLLDTSADKAADLAKRLTFYKLRARADILDRSGSLVVAVSEKEPRAPAGSVVYRDPRMPELGYRLVVPAEAATDLGTDAGAYHARRIALGVPEAGRDYALGDTFPHEANFDRLAGVDFRKGCFVGQEVVSRMQHKTIVRKRIVRVTAAAPLASGSEVKAGAAVIGVIGSTAGHEALALLRLDRAVEAAAKGEPVSADGQTLSIDADALARYDRDVAARKAAAP
ncbi:MAG: folate-binding protein [Hyphomicrobiaceae bacterium]